jgi:hypothetical protein
LVAGDRPVRVGQRGHPWVRASRAAHR